jgi:putative ABC transport system permease protein
MGLEVLRSAARAFRRSPTPLLVAVVTLSIGIAINLTIFALVNAVLLRPLPFPHSSELIALGTATKQGTGLLSWQDITSIRASTKSLANAAGYRKRTWGLSDSTGSPLEVVLSGMVTTEFMRTLDIAPRFGTDFQPQDGSEGNQQVVLLSYSLWQKRYHADLNAIGSSVELNAVPHRIVGVLPADFRFEMDGDVPDLYIPLSHADFCCDASARALEGIGRMIQGVSLTATNAELASSAHHLLPEGITFTATPQASFLARDRRRPLLLLWLAASLLSAIAALNAGAVLLAHALRHLRQYAIKASLGVSFRRLLGEQVAQACLLAGISSVLGLSSAVATLRILMQTSALHSVLHGEQSHAIIDWRMLLFTCALSLASALIACLLPLAMVRKLPLEQVLQEGAILSPSRRGRRLRSTLIVMQIALSVALFASATTLARSLHHLFSRNPGFREENVVIAGIGIPEARYNTDAKLIAFHEQAVQQLRNMPGVEEAGFGAGLPVHPVRTRFQLDSQKLSLAQRPYAPVAIASPELFTLLDMPLLAGRGFNTFDRLNHPYVAIVNQQFARRYLSGVNPLGAGMQLGFYNGNDMKPWSHFEIIGIVADSRNRTIAKETEPEIYLSCLQVPLEGGSYFLLTPRSAQTIANEVAGAVWKVDSQVERVHANALRTFVEGEYQESRVSIDVFSSFALIALALACIGLAASMNASVAETSREIGIRSALGQSPTSIACNVIRGSLVRTLIGVAIGMPLATILGKALSALWLGAPSLHVMELAAVAFLMEFVAFILALLPAWRATRISPMEAIRTV